MESLRFKLGMPAAVDQVKDVLEEIKKEEG